MSNKAIPLFVIAAGASFALQPTRPGRTDAVEALQARVTALEARVAILERRHPDRRPAQHPPPATSKASRAASSTPSPGHTRAPR
jgi:hypothetical protein